MLWQGFWIGHLVAENHKRLDYLVFASHKIVVRHVTLNTCRIADVQVGARHCRQVTRPRLATVSLVLSIKERAAHDTDVGCVLLGADVLDPLVFVNLWLQKCLLKELKLSMKCLCFVELLIETFCWKDVDCLSFFGDCQLLLFCVVIIQGTAKNAKEGRFKSTLIQAHDEANFIRQGLRAYLIRHTSVEEL